MEEINNNITPENSAEWLASCGFIFPRTEKELACFDTLYGTVDPAYPVEGTSPSNRAVTGEAVDPFRIIRNTAAAEDQAAVIPLGKPKTRNKLVATRLKPIPPHILQKLGKKDPGDPATEAPPTP